ncbi:hypothetical protein [Vibrio sp. CAU 1672]|uniref:hypothetical protein n=1 Tax=Vibrio sp. CAU 1672 TaxID=3032594 RepID=UPI0023DA0A39|nr:hypothetical protein [Vibrio sp. CAU 1672]MDF2154518.1 hypothetical protein [Vibrio sp. CAU 1672]
MKITKRLLASSIVMALAGCGGGGGNGSAGPSVSVQGKAIDGYIVGATVYLDLNFNGVMDSNEPNVVTQEEGNFDLAIPSQYQQCAQYVPVVVDVPVGAFDTDLPDTPIEEAYSMVFPPQFALSNDQDLLNLTPLTSVVWQQVEQELRLSQSSELSCKSILAEQALREDISRRLTEQEWRVANRYNVTVDELYGDYVETGNTTLHQIAQELVPGLQKSYQETQQLLKANPDADIAWVEHFLGKWDSTSDIYDDKWYRTEFVQNSNGNFKSETHIMADDLTTKLKLFEKRQMTTTQRSGVNIEQTVSLEEADTGYYCALSEWLETTLQQSSGVRNTVYGRAQDWSECLNVSGETTQALVTKDYDGMELLSYSEHTYQPGNDSGFRHLIGITNTITQDDLIPVRSVIDTDFYSEAGHGADFWLRTKNEFGDNPAQVMTTHTSDGKWERLINYQNGTHKKECGISESILSEANCS